MDLSKIATPSNEVMAMRENWKMTKALLGGTKEMRKCGKAFLPQFPKETDDEYKSRLSVSTLYPCFSETIAQMTGRVLSRDIDISAVDSRIVEFLDNIDRKGSRLSVVATEWFSDALAMGVSYMLVDYPTVDENATQADTTGFHPYFVHIHTDNILGYRSAIIDDKEQLVNFRYIETLSELDDDGFTEKQYNQVTMWEKNADGVFVSRYRNSSNNSAYYELSRIKISLDIIPIIAYQTQAYGFFGGEPPLSELAYLNVKHWQSQSDQDNILHTARVPLLAISGADDDLANNKSFVIGQTVSLLPTGSTMSYVEHSGAAIQAGQQSLIDLENQMAASGARMLMKTNIALTDSQARDENAKERSRLSLLAVQFADAIGECLDLMALWLGFKNGGVVSIQGNFDDITDPNNSLDSLIVLHVNGILSRETVFNEAKRRNIISETVKFDKENERISLETI